MVRVHTLLKRLKISTVAFLFILTQASLALTPFINPARAYANNHSGQNPATECGELSFLAKYEPNSEGTALEITDDEGSQNVVTFTNYEYKVEDEESEITGFNWSSTVAVDNVVVFAGNLEAIQSGNELTSGSYPTGFTGEDGFDETKGVSHVTFCYDAPVTNLELVKSLVPADDEGKFNLKIDGTTYASNVGDGGTTREQVVQPGSITVSETEGTATELTDYSTYFECKDANGTGSIVASGTRTGADSRQLTFDIVSGADVVCIITNTRANEVLVDYCDPSQKPAGMSIGQWLDANNVDGSDCFEISEIPTCGALDVAFTKNLTPYNYTIRYVLGDTTPELEDYEGDGLAPANFVEDENGGSIELTYYIVGPEEDYFVGFGMPNIWDQNGTTIVVDTNCEGDTGSLQVLKQVDEGEEGDGIEEVGYQPVGAESDFKWFLDDESTQRDMGSTASDLDTGTHEVTENIDDMTDYQFTGWFSGTEVEGQNDCENPQGTTLPVEVNVLADETTVVTLCNQVIEDRKVELCHATGSESNPFVYIKISAAGAFHGHLDNDFDGTHGDHQNGEDIIEPFTYKGTQYSQNWNTETEAFLRNECDAPEEGEKSTINVTKFNDLNRNGEMDNGEPVLSGWNMHLFTDQKCEYTSVRLLFPAPNNSECDEGSYDEVKTTLSNGVAIFTNLESDIEYILEEETKPGWTWSNTYCNYGYGQSVGYPQGENHYEITPAAGETVECYVGNVQDLSFTLQKENDTPIARNGDVVTYTLTYTVPEDSGVAFDVCVSDLLPEGFTFNGTWTATGNTTVENNVEEASDECGDPEANGPSYGNDGPAEWYLGDVHPGATIVLTYEVEVGEDVTPGTYTNIAYASANNCPVEIRGENETCEETDTPFVYSDVTLLAGGRGGQLLGASTTRTLVDTGDDSVIMTIVAAILLTTSFLAVRKKQTI